MGGATRSYTSKSEFVLRNIRSFFWSRFWVLVFEAAGFPTADFPVRTAPFRKRRASSLIQELPQCEGEERAKLNVVPFPFPQS